MSAECWAGYFLESQDYHVTENIVYQDNQSSILLEKNSYASGSNRTNHINILLLFVTDIINEKELMCIGAPQIL